MRGDVSLEYTNAWCKGKGKETSSLIWSLSLLGKDLLLLVGGCGLTVWLGASLMAALYGGVVLLFCRSHYSKENSKEK